MKVDSIQSLVLCAHTLRAKPSQGRRVSPKGVSRHRGNNNTRGQVTVLTQQGEPQVSTAIGWERPLVRHVENEKQELFT